MTNQKTKRKNKKFIFIISCQKKKKKKKKKEINFPQFFRISENKFRKKIKLKSSAFFFVENRKKKKFFFSHMGSTIAKFAFQPPPKDQSEKYLLNNCKSQLQFVLSEHEKEEICFMRFSPVRSIVSMQTSPIFTAEHQAENNKYTILFCHGNAEDLAHSHRSYQDLSNKLGSDLIAFDYPGYACSSSVPSEEGAIAAGDAVLAHLINKLALPRDRIILCGRSLGSGVATDLASRNRGLGGLVLISPLKSAAAVASSAAYYGLYPFDIFANIRKIGKVVDYPIMIFHGDNDTVVPYEHGTELAKEAKQTNSQVTFVHLAGAGHNDIEAMRGKEYYSAFRAFISNSAIAREKLSPKKKNSNNDDDGDSSGNGASCFSSISSSTKK
jgi:pimeloyl-ACP methyl ester carboxylesterase